MTECVRRDEDPLGEPSLVVRLADGAECRGIELNRDGFVSIVDCRLPFAAGGRQSLDRLADFAPTTAPVISLYLDGRPDQHGRERYGLFVRKELATHSRRWPPRSPERESFHRDVDRILTWLHEEARPSATGLAIFACAAASDFFETVQLDVPIEEPQTEKTDLYDLVDEPVARTQQGVVDLQSAAVSSVTTIPR